MTIDQWKGYLFTEQLSQAAEGLGCMQKKYFFMGGYAALSSELVREMEKELEHASSCLEQSTPCERYCDPSVGFHSEYCSMARGFRAVLQKLTEARGNL